MTHCIQTSGAAGHDNLHSKAAEIPSVDEESWTNPVLTVQDPYSVYECQMPFLFHPREGLVVNPWNKGKLSNSALRVTGEDLFAFRELLNELPEELFVRPADPEVEFTLLLDGEGAWWTECADGTFRLTGSDFERLEFVYFEDGGLDLATIDATWGIDGEPKSHWNDDDIIVFEGSTFNRVYQRREGAWHVIGGKPTNDTRLDVWADAAEADASHATSRWTVIRKGA